jgi:hypothetical protein
MIVMRLQLEKELKDFGQKPISEQSAAAASANGSGKTALARSPSAEGERVEGDAGNRRDSGNNGVGA